MCGNVHNKGNSYMLSFLVFIIASVSKDPDQEICSE